MKTNEILSYASSGAGTIATVLPAGPWSIAAAAASGLLALGAQIAADDEDPVPQVERVRDQWPTVKAALSKAAEAKAAAKAAPIKR